MIRIFCPECKQNLLISNTSNPAIRACRDRHIEAFRRAHNHPKIELIFEDSENSVLVSTDIVENSLFLSRNTSPVALDRELENR